MQIKNTIKKYIEEKLFQKALELISPIDIDQTEDIELIWLCYEAYASKGYIVKAMKCIKRLESLTMIDEKMALAMYTLGLETGDMQATKKGVKFLIEHEIDPYKAKKTESQYLKKFSPSDPKYIQLLEELEEIMYDEESVYDLAMIYYDLGDIKKSRKLCKKLIRYFPYGDIIKAQEFLEMPTSSSLDTPLDTPVDASSNIPTEPPSTLPKQVNKPVKKMSFMNKFKKKKPIEVEPVINLPAPIEKEFAAFIGMNEVKQHIASFANQITLDKQRSELLGVESSKTGYNFMITGNPGTGKTTVARTLAKTLHILGITENQNFTEVDKSGLVGQYIGHTEDKTKEVINQAMGGVLFIDEAYTLYNKDDPKDFGRQALEVIMKSMEDHRGDICVILAGYQKEMNELLNFNPGLKSRINIKINIPDYSDEELLKIADKIAEDRGFIITEEAKEVILGCIYKERIDNKFGNARFIRELIDVAHRNLATRLASKQKGKYSAKDMMQLTSKDFNQEEIEDPNKVMEESLKELNQLIGLKQAKDKVNSVVNQLIVEKEMQKQGITLGKNVQPSMHMLYKGNPGTGKTTVARIIGNIYKALGVLKRGDVFLEVTRGDLVGQHLGETAKKVKDVVAQSMGGILFIDEAYALYQGKDDSFGKEAIDTLIAEMENNRDKLLVVLAGYSTEMDELLSSNPGFKSRINTQIIFEDYTADEMLEIFKGIIEKSGLQVEPGGYPEVLTIIKKESQDPYFGNARGVRNLYEHILTNQKNRLAAYIGEGRKLQESDYRTINKMDITQH